MVYEKSERMKVYLAALWRSMKTLCQKRVPCHPIQIVAHNQCGRARLLGYSQPEGDSPLAYGDTRRTGCKSWQGSKVDIKGGLEMKTEIVKKDWEQFCPEYGPVEKGKTYVVGTLPKPIYLDEQQEER